MHKELGPGLLEKIYEACFCHELAERAIPYERQMRLPIHYKGLDFDEGLKMDVYVDRTIICELKSVDIINPVWQAEIISHLKMTKNHIGFWINFNVGVIKDGIRRFSVE